MSVEQAPTRRKRRERPLVEYDVTDLDSEGRGVARGEDGKVVFVVGALPGERVSARVARRKRQFDEARVETVHAPSATRVEPGCTYFGTCGGCSLQHLSYDAQVAFKQAQLESTLAKVGGVAPARWLEPLRSAPWSYRRRARLGAKHVAAKESVVVGFREKHAPYITDALGCETLDAAAARHIPGLRELLFAMDARARIPQIEVATTESSVAFVFRHLDPLSPADSERLRAFAKRTGVQLWLQPGGPETVAPLVASDAGPLRYRLAEHDVELQFEPTDFVQVNAGINAQLVTLALNLLEADASTRVLDLFCGIGNFSLPLARRAGHVVGIEASSAMTQRAAANARRNAIHNAKFVALDLQRESPLAALSGAHAASGFDAWLLDPPRSGAAQVLEGIGDAGPRRIVYVSCNPATLARDLALLVDRHGYRLQVAGLADMFPQTAHAEAICLLTRDAPA